MKVIAVGKKIPVEDYLTATIYLTAMKEPDDDNDKEEERASSRTSYGQTWKIGKSHPWLTEPLSIWDSTGKPCLVFIGYPQNAIN